MATEHTDAPAFSFLGLRIERKTDLLAATAFLLAIVTTSYQFWGFVRGARLTVYPPDRIVLFYDSAGGQTLLRFAGDVTFVNHGQTGRDVVVRDVNATLFLDDTPVTRQRWLNAVRLERQDDEPSLEPLESAHPVQVPGSSAVSRTFSFSPRSEDCGGTLPCAQNFVPTTAFTERMQRAKRLALLYEVRSFGHRRIATARCEVTLTKAHRLTLLTDAWLVLPCVERTTG